MKNLLKIFFLLIALLAFSCAQRIPTLFSVRQEIETYYESGGFDKEITQVVEDAINKFKSIKANDSAAVIFDIDETALSYLADYSFYGKAGEILPEILKDYKELLTD